MPNLPVLRAPVLRRLLVICVAVIACCGRLFATTNVSGQISGNVTWGAAQSPFAVTGDVQVPSGSTLTIEAGVTVKFSAANQIYIQGTLIANGTSALPIVFASATPGTSSGATILKFEGANLSNSQLSYVQFSDAARAVQVGNGTAGVPCTGTLTLTQPTIANAEVRTAGYDTAAALDLDHATLSNVTVIGQYPSSEPVTLTASTVTNSVIFSDSYNRGITLNNTAVSSSQLKIACCGANIVVNGGSLTGSSVVQTNDGPVLNLTGVTLTNSTVALPTGMATLSNCTISYDGSTTPKVMAASGSVTGSTFTGAGTGVGLEFDGTGGDVTVSSSTFTGFASALKFSGLRTSGTLTIQPGNHFSGNSSYNLENRTGRAVSSIGTDWGTTDPFAIAQKIYDNSDNAAIGAVYVIDPASLAITGQPSSATVAPGTTVNFTVTATGSSSLAYQWYKNGSAITGATNATFSVANAQPADAASYGAIVTDGAGSLASNPAVLAIATSGPINVSGQMSGTTTWTAALSPYVLTGDVQVPAGSTLTIEAGVTVKYSGAYQIYVQGALVANGTSASPILFASSTPGTSTGATMLKFEGANLSNSQLSYVQFSDAAKAIQVGNGTSGVACTGTLTITHPTVTNAEVRTAGYNTAAALVLDHATLSNVTVIGQYPLSEPITLTASNVTNSVVFSDSYNKGITLANTTVNSSQLKIACCGANIVVNGGSLTGSSVVQTNDGPVLNLTGVALTNSTIALPTGTATLSNCTVTYDGSITPQVMAASGSVTGSTFTGTGAGIALEFEGTGGNVTVSSSTFTGFGTGVKFSGARTSGTLTTQPGNHFSSNSTYNLDNETAQPIDATGTDWGTTDPFVIAAKIHDHADNTAVGAVAVVNPAGLSITTQPTSATVAPGAAVTFSVSATGTSALSYQWYKNGSAITGATDASFTISNAQSANVGTYAVGVTNSSGTLASNNASLLLATTGPVNVSGLISGNVTWTAALSPYIVAGNVQVPAGSTLTIAPGVTVKYAGAYQIYVQGTLVANGTSTSPIAFVSSTPGTSSGATILKFEGTNLANSQLSYVQFSDAAKAILVGGGGGEFNPGIPCTGTLTVSYPTITNAEVRTGGYQTSAALLLDHATITNATVIGQYPASEPITVNNSQLQNSIVFSDSYNQGISVTNSGLTSSQVKIGCCGANVTLTGSTFSYSSVVETNLGASLSMVGTLLTNSTVSLPNGSATISHCGIVHTTATDPIITLASGSVSDTTFNGNGGGVGLAFTGTTGDVTLLRNTFATYATAVKFSGSRTAGNLLVRINNFQGIVGYAIENRTHSAITATANYWNTTDPTAIAQHIFDYNDDITSGVVDTSVFLTGPFATPTIQTQPTAATVTAAEPTNFAVVATSVGHPTYQWRKAGSAIGGATNATFSIPITNASDAGNYDCVVTDEIGSVTSNAVALTFVKGTATVTLGNLSAVYSGTPVIAAASTPPVLTTPSSLAINLTYNGSSVPPTAAGSYTVTATVNDANYNGTATGTLVISPAPLTLTADSKTKVYGTDVPPLTGAITGFVHGETAGSAGITGTASFATTATAATGVGDYAVTATVGTLSAANYAFTIFVPGTLTITKAPLTVTADSKTRAYATANPPFTAVVTGFVNGQTLATSGVSGSASFATTAQTGSNAGTYPINVAAGTFSAANYAFTTFVPGTLTIAAAPTTITIGDTDQTYDGSPKPVSITLSPAAAVCQVTYNGSATIPIGAGTYAVVATVTDSNHGGTATATLTIAKAQQTVSFDSLPATLSVGVPFLVFTSSDTGRTPNLSIASGNATVHGAFVTLLDSSPVVLQAGVAGDENHEAAIAQLTVTATKQNQSITFARPSDVSADAKPIALTATATSGLPVTFALVSGPATLSGHTITLSGAVGTVTVRASQAGDSTFNAAPDVTQSFAVTLAKKAPEITVQPLGLLLKTGDTATLSITATGIPAPSYQWRKNGGVIVGATNTTLSLPNVTLTDAGSYDVAVSNPVGTISSALARVLVTSTDVAPSIVTQPASTTVLRGAEATFSVVSTGVPAPSYQWMKDGIPMADETGPILTLPNAQSGDAGAYAVTVTNRAGYANSATAQLRVIARSYAGSYFGNIGTIGFFAIYVRDDNTGVLLGYLTQSKVPFVALDLTVDDNGHFSFSTPGSPISPGARAVVTADAGQPHTTTVTSGFTFDGMISTSGQIIGALSGGESASLSATKSADVGPTSVMAGFYEAGTSGESTATYSIVSPAGQALVLTQSASGADAGTGTVTRDGAINVTTANNNMVTATVAADSSIITGQVTLADGQSVGFRGASENIIAQQRFTNVSARTIVGSGSAVSIAGFVIGGVRAKSMLIRAAGPALTAFGVQDALAKPTLSLYAGTTLITSNSGWSTAPNADEIAAAGARAGAFPFAVASTDSAVFTTLVPGNYTAIVSSADGKPGVALVEAYDLSDPEPGQKMINTSVRAQVGNGENVCVAGFVITGTVPKRVLIRGIGPSLATFGITGLLPRPQITLYRGSAAIAQNAGWNTLPDAPTLSTLATQVGAFPFASNEDAALLLSLDPGSYTVQLAGVSGSTGIGLVEVYEVP